MMKMKPAVREQIVRCLKEITIVVVRIDCFDLHLLVEVDEFNARQV